MNSIFDGTTVPLLEKIAIFGERRNDVLASNIANIDTPNYKRRDLPIEAFQKALREAIATGRSRTAQNVAASGSPGDNALAGEPSTPFTRQLFQAINAESPSLTFQDNNNRSIEHEMMELTKNSLIQSFAIELMNAQMGMLQTAIRGQI